jgi:uncharacterized OB-fold protein
VIRESAIRIPFRYAAGEAGSRFLAALRDESRVLGGRCTSCGRVFVPLRSYCATCGSGTFEEIEVGPGGTVQAWTARADGTVFALVRLDGADTALLHRLLADPARSRSGMRVRARFAAERRASILDIAGFEPEERAGA